MVANQAEIYQRTEGRPRPRHAAAALGGWLDPEVVEAFERSADAIYAELDAGSVWDTVLEEEPWAGVVVSEHRVDDLAEALADAVDLKSPYFLGHSPGVARLAEQARYSSV